jgi:urease accessory protein
MPTDPRLLTLTQWLSPAYPTGAFAYSHGIEQAIAEGWIEDRAGLADWLSGCLAASSLRSDAIFLRLAQGAPEAERLAVLEDWARAWAASSERLVEAERQGRAFVETTNGIWLLDLPPLLLPLAVGAAAGRAGLEVEATLALYLQAGLSNLISGAMRLMALGQVAGQGLLAELTPLCLEVVTETRDATLEDIHSSAFLSDIAAMRHETLQPRLFQT